MFSTILATIVLLVGLSIQTVKSERSEGKENYQSQNSQYEYQYPYTFASPGAALIPQQTTEIPREARDSYVESASNLGYQTDNLGPASTYHYQIEPDKVGGSYSPPSSQYGRPSTEYGRPSTEYGKPSSTSLFGKGSSSGGYGGGSSGGYGDSGGLGGDLGGENKGLLGLLGLLGLKGLVPFIWPLIIPLIPILLPILAPLLIILSPILFLLKLPLLPLLLIPLIILLPLLALMPVPLIQIRRSLPGQQRINLLESILYRDECVERISCEVSRIVSASGFNAPWMRKIAEKSSPKSKWINRISRAAANTDCSAYTCGIVKSMKESFNIEHE